VCVFVQSLPVGPEYFVALNPNFLLEITKTLLTRAPQQVCFWRLLFAVVITECFREDFFLSFTHSCIQYFNSIGCTY